MFLRIAQVKCHNCGRVCGEINAHSAQSLKLDNIYIPEYASGYRSKDGNTIKCARCGGSVYVDDPLTIGSAELTVREDTVEPSGVAN